MIAALGEYPEIRMSRDDREAARQAPVRDGDPAAAGTAMALVIPGTTSTAIPARRQAAASSPPRPST